MAIPISYNIRNMILRKGSTSELAGGFTKDKLPILTALPGIAKTARGGRWSQGSGLWS